MAGKGGGDYDLPGKERKHWATKIGARHEEHGTNLESEAAVQRLKQ